VAFDQLFTDSGEVTEATGILGAENVALKQRVAQLEEEEETLRKNIHDMRVSHEREQHEREESSRRELDLMEDKLEEREARLEGVCFEFIFI
jgi:predicted  nucleic acid-binding Zn-ribbon protein